MSSPYALSVEDVSVRFGGVHALEHVSMTVPGGRVHGVIGPNGSGKTTLLNALCGFVSATGACRLYDTSLTRMPPHRRVAAGLGRTFQNPRVDHTLTVRALLRLGEHLRGLQPWWMVTLAPLRADRSLAESNERAIALLELVGLDASILDTRLINLPSGVLKMIDIVRALLAQPRVLLLDEPTSGMNEGEIRRLRDVLADMGRNDELTIILVEHNVPFVSGICESLTVLDRGRLVGDGAPDEVLARQEVIAAYLGDAVPEAVASTTDLEGPERAT
jgi:ABC-type branched-subunit amino acid transport system ATPase component